jgi:hypothetical protein
MTDLLVEVVPRVAVTSGDLSPGARVVAVPEVFARRCREISDSIVEVAREFRSRLDVEVARHADSDWDLQEVTLSFALTVLAETGVVIAKASAEGTFTAELTWHHSGPR